MTSEAQLPTIRKRRWRRKVVVLPIVIGLVAVVAHSLDSPAVGHQQPVTQQAVTVKQTTPKLPPATSTTNAYYQLNLPVGYTPQTVSTTTSGLLVSQTLIKPGDFGSLVVAIGVSQLTDGLSNNSSYHLRAQSPQTYAMSSQNIDGDSVSIAVRRDGSEGEVTAFWPHGGYLATISVTDGVANAGTSDSGPDQTVLLQVLRAWQWQ